MKKVIFTSFLLLSTGSISFMGLEPGPMMAASMGDQFQTVLNVVSEISLTDCTNITMSPNIGLSQDSSIGTTTCSVDTSNSAGYTLTVSASTSPALRSSAGYFSDVSTSSMPANWSTMLPTTSNIFGFSLYGDDVNTSVWGTNTTSCGNAGPSDITAANRNWYGFWTTATTVIDRDTSTSGLVPFVLCVAAEQGSATSVPSGVYTATTTLTAITQ